jgi:rod shape-determining protein MreC
VTERWTYALLLALLLGHLFLLSTHPRTQGNRLERLLLTSLGPIGHGVVAASDAAGDFFESFRLAGSLRRENAVLRAELDTLRHELVRLQGLKEDFELLSRNLGYTPPETGDVVVADVVWLDQESWLETLVLYTGTVAPRRNQPVLTDQGLVGRVTVPAGRYAKVLLLSDPSFVVSAMIVRTRQRGLVRGGDVLQLENFPLLADVEVGDEVVSAGIDGVFPRGIPIGRVVSVEPGQGLFQEIEVEAAVDFAALDQVYVLTLEALPAEVRENLDLGDGE